MKSVQGTISKFIFISHLHIYANHLVSADIITAVKSVVFVSCPLYDVSSVHWRVCDSDTPVISSESLLHRSPPFRPRLNNMWSICSLIGYSEVVNQLFLVCHLTFFVTPRNINIHIGSSKVVHRLTKWVSLYIFITFFLVYFKKGLYK